MKNVHLQKSAPISAADEGNISDQIYEQKNVVADECGDSLWDDVLEHTENNKLLKSNCSNDKKIDDIHEEKEGT
jgi:hypothetical protein